MIIQIILIVVLLAVGVNFIGSRNSSATRAVKKVGLLLSIPCAVVVIIVPESTTRLAHLVGVGRGADLLLYMFMVFIIFQLFDNYIKNKEDQKRIVTLARKIAILEASTAKSNE